MIVFLKKSILYFRLIWQHLIYWIAGNTDESYYTNIGIIYYELEKYRKAIGLFKKSEKSRHEQNTSYQKFNTYFLGYCYLLLGDFRNAINYLEEHLKFNTDDLESLNFLFFCYRSLKNKEAALETCRRIQQVDPHSPLLHIDIALVLGELDRKQEAHKHLDLAEEGIEGEGEKTVLEIHIDILFLEKT